MFPKDSDLFDPFDLLDPFDPFDLLDPFDPFDPFFLFDPFSPSDQLALSSINAYYSGTTDPSFP